MRIWVIGDSLAGPMGGAMVPMGQQTGVVVTYMDQKNGSSLVRTDEWDWPAVVRERLPEVRPDVIVTMLGANDGQPLFREGVQLERNTEGWFEVYRGLVERFMDQIGSAVTQVYWVGVPVMEGPNFTRRTSEYNALYQELIESRPNFTYISTLSVLTDSQGQYLAEVPNGDEDPIPLRHEDGVHFAALGAWRVARVVMRTIASEWGFEELLG